MHFLLFRTFVWDKRFIACSKIRRATICLFHFSFWAWMIGRNFSLSCSWNVYSIWLYSYYDRIIDWHFIMEILSFYTIHMNLSTAPDACHRLRSMSSILTYFFRNHFSLVYAFEIVQSTTAAEKWFKIRLKNPTNPWMLRLKTLPEEEYIDRCLNIMTFLE